jgi:hypothetical protein
MTCNQLQQQLQQYIISTSNAHPTLSYDESQYTSSTHAAAAAGASFVASKQPHAASVNVQPAAAAAASLPAAAAPVITNDAPDCSSSAAAHVASSEGEDDGDCLLLEPKWVTPDGGEVDLNKVSDYELRSAKVSLTQSSERKSWH